MAGAADEAVRIQTDEHEAANGQKLWRRLAAMETILARLRLTTEMQARVDAAIRRLRKLTPAQPEAS
jgi:hypothetical protein